MKQLVHVNLVETKEVTVMDMVTVVKCLPGIQLTKRDIYLTTLNTYLTMIMLELKV